MILPGKAQNACPCIGNLGHPVKEFHHKNEGLGDQKGISEVAKRERVPFNGLRAVVLTAMIENVLLDGGTESTFHPVGRTPGSLRG